jgi:hypothetical protein
MTDLFVTLSMNDTRLSSIKYNCAECHVFIVMLSVIMQNVVMMSVVMMSVMAPMNVSNFFFK